MKRVKISYHKWNYSKDDESYLLEEHVNYCYNFREGFGKVQYHDDTENFVNLEGKTLLKTNVKLSISFEKVFAAIKINNIWYYIDTECNFYNQDKISFKELYKLYPNKRQELINIIEKYTYFNIEEYFI